MNWMDKPPNVFINPSSLMRIWSSIRWRALALARAAEQADRAGRVIRSVHQFVRRRERLREVLARGEALGSPELKAGGTVTIVGMGDQVSGTYRLTAYADDADGHTTWLGARTLTAANSSAKLPITTAPPSNRWRGKSKFYRSHSFSSTTFVAKHDMC